jgi:hypothetical protein
MSLILSIMRRLILILAGLYGLWLFSAGVMNVLITGHGSFAPPMWSELVLGAAILAGSVLLWRERAHRGVDQKANAADRHPAAPAADGQRR